MFSRKDEGVLNAGLGEGLNLLISLENLNQTLF